MPYFTTAHNTLQECQEKMFFSPSEIEKCQKAWMEIVTLLCKDQDGTLFELYKESKGVQESVRFLSVMFGQDYLLSKTEPASPQP